VRCLIKPDLSYRHVWVKNSKGSSEKEPPIFAEPWEIAMLEADITFRRGLGRRGARLFREVLRDQPQPSRQRDRTAHLPMTVYGRHRLGRLGVGSMWNGPAERVRQYEGGLPEGRPRFWALRRQSNDALKSTRLCLVFAYRSRRRQVALVTYQRRLGKQLHSAETTKKPWICTLSGLRNAEPVR